VTVLRVSQPAGHPAFWAGLAFLAYLQLSVALLNLLPVPGLDGWGIIEPYCSTSAQAAAARVRPFGFFIVFALFATGSLGDRWAELVTRLATELGLPAPLWMVGAWMFQFWRL
jgi:Zn-dependent protease